MTVANTTTETTTNGSEPHVPNNSNLRPICCRRTMRKKIFVCVYDICSTNFVVRINRSLIKKQFLHYLVDFFYCFFLPTLIGSISECESIDKGVFIKSKVRILYSGHMVKGFKKFYRSERSLV